MGSVARPDLSRRALDHVSDLGGMRLVDRMARALDDGHMAAGPLVVEAFQLRIDDLVAAGDDAPTWLRFSRGRGQRRVEDAAGR